MLCNSRVLLFPCSVIPMFFLFLGFVIPMFYIEGVDRGAGVRGWRVRNRGWRVLNRAWRGREAGVEGAGSGDRGGGEPGKIGAGNCFFFFYRKFKENGSFRPISYIYFEVAASNGVEDDAFKLE